MANTLTLLYGTTEYTATVYDDGRVRVGEQEIIVTALADGTMTFPGSSAARAWAISAGEKRWVFLDGRTFEFDVQRSLARRKRGGSHHGSLSAPMPATVRRINVATGDRIARGDTLMILEAMKMELPVKAGAPGTVQAINCREGQLVQPGATLIELVEDD